MKQLQALKREGRLSDLDISFARLLCRLAGTASDELAWGAALASHATGKGHVCLDLAAEADRPICPDGATGPTRLPGFENWVAALKATSVVGDPGAYCPLILDRAGRLYLYRYWKYEQDIALALNRRAAAPAGDIDEARLQSDLQLLFPAAVRPDWQKVAAAAAVLNRFSVISGGPGTGKTSTVIRILALLRQQPGGLDLRIALAAPTGKAAARMQEAIHQAKQQLPVDDRIRSAIPEEAMTLHRLLGARMDSIHFWHDRQNPLPVDVLILDEASMVDIALMAKLMRALPETARLIMLGDKDQLSSVEAGAVLADICGKGPRFSTAFHDRLSALLGEALPCHGGSVPAIADAVLLLHRSYRFSDESGIGRLAKAVNRGDANAVRLMLDGGQWPDIRRYPASHDLAAEAVEGYRHYLECVQAGADIDRIFAAFNRFQVLCAVREGPDGVVVLNRKIEQALVRHNLIDAAGEGYAGRPIMVMRNDHGLRIYNGDVGLLLPDPTCSGRLRACFRGVDGHFRRLAPALLPQHETAYAMTVHKSQGSEFERVLLVLPEEEGPLLSRELLYTGITRAKSRFELCAGDDILLSAVQRRLSRTTGLQDLLWQSHLSRSA